MHESPSHRSSSESSSVQTFTPELIPAVDHTPPTRLQEGKIFTRSFTGRFRQIRLVAAGFLALLFFGTSWVNWNGHQAVLWDITHRQFHVFGATFWPQDFLLLSFAMLIGALLLFVVTVYAGRVWCGYSCPQSVWTWAFMWAEKITEGDRHQRIRLDSAPLTTHKLARVSAKHALWIGMSLATGIAFVGYFVPVRELVASILAFEWATASVIWVGIVAGMTYLNAGFVREKVCMHMCPYARFQSVLFDRQTRVIAYDAARGDARGSRKRTDDPKALGLGDCIDCHVCVQVCPTGIDIRNGLQMDCIGCAACIDACDEVMDKMGYERGLVRYSSEAELAGEPYRPWRARMIGYAAVLVVSVIGLMMSINARDMAELSVEKDRSIMYRVTPEGDVVNVYRIKVVNKTQAAVDYTLTVDNPAFQLSKPYAFQLNAGEVFDLPVRVITRQEAQTDGLTTIDFVLTDSAAPALTVRESARFMYPNR